MYDDTEHEHHDDFSANLRKPTLAASESDTWQRALMFARNAHGDQMRKHTDEPYWHHVQRVAAAVSAVPARPMAAVVAALLHDVLEDTATRASEIKEAFGADVLALVRLLTDPPKEFGNRKARKAEVIRKLRDGDAWAQTIKVADLLDNAPSIIAHDPKFAVTFIAEKRDLLSVLTRADAGLLAQAREIVA